MCNPTTFLCHHCQSPSSLIPPLWLGCPTHPNPSYREKFISETQICKPFSLPRVFANTDKGRLAIQATRKTLADWNSENPSIIQSPPAILLTKQPLASSQSTHHSLTIKQPTILTESPLNIQPTLEQPRLQAIRIFCSRCRDKWAMTPLYETEVTKCTLRVEEKLMSAGVRLSGRDIQAGLKEVDEIFADGWDGEEGEVGGRLDEKAILIREVYL